MFLKNQDIYIEYFKTFNYIIILSWNWAYLFLNLKVIPRWCRGLWGQWMELTHPLVRLSKTRYLL